MKILNLSIVFSGLVLLAGCQTTGTTQGAKGKDVVYAGASFNLIHPSFVVSTVEQGDGYAVHYLRSEGSKSMLGIYEGQRPRLFSAKENDLTMMRRGTTTRGNIERGDDKWGVDSNSLLWRESVWSCTRVIYDTQKSDKSYKIPTMLHLWYFGATEDEATLFDTIIDTIEMKR